MDLMAYKVFFEPARLSANWYADFKQVVFIMLKKLHTSANQIISVYTDNKVCILIKIITTNNNLFPQFTIVEM